MAGWLQASGWQVLAVRWRSPYGELDLVCLDAAGVLVAVEVKLRRTRRAGSPWDAVDARRLSRLRRSLAAYAAVAGQPGELRVDLVAVEPSGTGWRLSRTPGIDRL